MGGELGRASQSEGCFGLHCHWVLHPHSTLSPLKLAVTRSLASIRCVADINKAQLWKTAPLMRKEAGSWRQRERERERPRPGPHLKPGLLQPWPRFFLSPPRATPPPSKPGPTKPWEEERTQSQPSPSVAHSHPIGPTHRGHLCQERISQGTGSPREAASTFPKVTFCPQTCRALALSSPRG